MIPKELFSKIHELMPIACVDLVIYDLLAGLLLIRRSVEPMKGKWWFPGGRIEKGESLQDAVKRIAMQEVGLKLGMIRQLETRQTYFDEDPFGHRKGTHTINTLYLAFPLSVGIKLDDNHSEWRWFPDPLGEPDISNDIKEIFDKLDFNH